MAMHCIHTNKTAICIGLTGIDQEDTMLVLYPDSPDAQLREILVLLRPNELKEKWDGKRLRANEATAISGINKIVWLDVLEAVASATDSPC